MGNARARQRGWSRTWLVYVGLLAVVTIASFSLLCVCLPRHQLPKINTNSKQTEAGGSHLTTEAAVGSNIDVTGALKIRLTPGTYHKVVDGKAVEDASLLPGGVCSQGRCPNGTVAESDFVFATASHEFNEPAFIAGRAGRMGMRTYVATNYTPTPEHPYPVGPNETWGYYPDASTRRSYYGGDSRAALVPFLAFRDLGSTFKWLFYGDVDTLFFVDAGMDLVRELDPDMPYFLTDHFWYSNRSFGYPWHPHWRAPRCLPCHSDIDTSQLRMGMAKACPCTPAAMCDLARAYDGVFDNRTCTPPRAPTLPYSMHGGAGALISVGMLRQVDFQVMEKCVLGEWNTGGDSFITTCLWQSGFGMTDPGPLWHPDGLTRFDPSPRKLIFDHTAYVLPRSAFTIGNFLASAAGVCHDTCQLEARHVVSLHLRARLLTNTSEGAGVLLRSVARAYGHLHGRIQQLENGRLDVGVPDTHEPRAAALADELDKGVIAAIARLRGMGPRLKQAAAQQVKWPVDNNAAFLLPTENPSIEGTEWMQLSEDELTKGTAAGIAHGVLEAALAAALQLYPPP